MSVANDDSVVPATSNADRYYQPSGRIPAMGATIMFGTGLVGALVMAFLYAVIDYYIPSFKLRFMASLAFCMGVGWWGYNCSKWGKIRHRGYSAVVGFCVGVCTLYFAWMCFVFLLSGWDTKVLFPEPMSLWNVIEQIRNQGLWAVKEAVISPGRLAFFWSVEAFLVIGISTLVASAPTDPFCESCNSWTKKAGQHLCGLDVPPVIVAQLESEQYEILPELLSRPPADTCFVFTVNACLHCDESHYLNLELRTINPENKESSDRPVMQHLSIPSEVAEMVRTAKTIPVAPDSPTGV